MIRDGMFTDTSSSLDGEPYQETKLIEAGHTENLPHTS